MKCGKPLEGQRAKRHGDTALSVCLTASPWTDDSPENKSAANLCLDTVYRFVRCSTHRVHGGMGVRDTSRIPAVQLYHPVYRCSAEDTVPQVPRNRTKGQLQCAYEHPETGTERSTAGTPALYVAVWQNRGAAQGLDGLLSWPLTRAQQIVAESAPRHPHSALLIPPNASDSPTQG